MFPHITKRLAVAWIAIWVVTAMLALPMLTQYRQEQNEKRQYKEALQVQQRDLGLQDELNVYEQQLRGKARAAEDRRRGELEAALGGPTAAAFKNPDYSLREALTRAARACVPPNSDVRIKVERFTEFTAEVESDGTLSTNAMTAFARCFLPNARKYVHAIRFSTHGNLFAELDRDDIELIEDWTRAPAERIAKLLAIEEPTQPQDPGALDRIRQEQKIGEALRTDQAAAPKVELAQRKLGELIRQSYDDLSSALSLAQKAVSMDAVRKASDLDAHEKDLREARAAADRAKAFWAAPEKKWRELLEAEGISAETVKALNAGLPAMLPPNPAALQKVFTALDAQLESARYFLRMAGDQFGKWNFRSETGQFGFTDEEFGRRFLRAQQHLHDDSQAVETALHAWNESLTR